MVAIVSITLNSIGLTWGQNGDVPWQSDSLGGVTTLRQMPYLFGRWKYKYPRVQFLINAAFYKPMLDRWKKDPVWSTAKGGTKTVQRVLNFDRINTLIMTSNIISAIMGAATVVAVFLTVKILFDESVFEGSHQKYCRSRQAIVFYGLPGHPGSRGRKSKPTVRAFLKTWSSLLEVNP